MFGNENHIGPPAANVRAKVTRLSLKTYELLTFDVIRSKGAGCAQAQN